MADSSKSFSLAEKRKYKVFVLLPYPQVVERTIQYGQHFPRHISFLLDSNFPLGAFFLWSLKICSFKRAVEAACALQQSSLFTTGLPFSQV